MGEAADALALRFEEHRPHLRAVAYRMLGSLSEADDALQDAWLKASRADTGAVRNLGGWLTTVVGRVCLDMLRSRSSRREEPLPDHEVPVPMPDVVVSGPQGPAPEQEILLADAVGVALLVVLRTLAPAERLAFVLHDMFAVPFDEIAPVLDRTPAAARQLASRARRRVQDAAPPPDADPAAQRALVDAFLAAARAGDFDALVAVLDPDVVARADGGTLLPSSVRRGAANVAGSAIMFSRAAVAAVPYHVMINGVPGLAGFVDGRPVSLMAFTMREGRVTALDILADPERLARLGLPALLGL